MSKVLVVYWSGTGNTEMMAEEIAKGATSAGAEVVCKNVEKATVAEIAEYDVAVFGSPSMGAEAIEETEMEPFFSEAEKTLGGKKVAIFGSYGWGDGEWLRSWAGRCAAAGAVLLDDGLAVHETPNEAALAQCAAYGEKLAAF
jgi:flavodoxin short chain